ncbi:MAG: hypothetical protein JXR14_05180 [Paracoccaceae bacterium]
MSERMPPDGGTFLRFSLLAHLAALASLYLIDFLSFLVSLHWPKSTSSYSGWDDYYGGFFETPLFFFMWGGLSSYFLSIFAGFMLAKRLPLSLRRILVVAVIVGFFGTLPGTVLLLFIDADLGATTTDLLISGLGVLGFGAAMGLMGGAWVWVLCRRKCPVALVAPDKVSPLWTVLFGTIPAALHWHFLLHSFL